MTTSLVAETSVTPPLKFAIQIRPLLAATAVGKPKSCPCELAPEGEDRRTSGRQRIPEMNNRYPLKARMCPILQILLQLVIPSRKLLSHVGLFHPQYIANIRLL